MRRKRLVNSITGAIALIAGVAYLQGGNPLAVLGSQDLTIIESASAQGIVTINIPAGATGKGRDAYGENPKVVQQGATVVWTNTDTVAHTVTSDDPNGPLKSETLNPGQSYSYTFNNPGTYPYHCAIHGQQSMSGTIQVNGAGGAVPAAGSTGVPVAGPTSGPTARPTGGATPPPVDCSQYYCSGVYCSNNCGDTYKLPGADNTGGGTTGGMTGGNTGGTTGGTMGSGSG
jgi:plastocyanin